MNISVYLNLSEKLHTLYALSQYFNISTSYMLLQKEVYTHSTRNN